MKNLKTDITSDGDTGKYGLVIWTNTKNQRKAKTIINKMLKQFNKGDESVRNTRTNRTSKKI